LSQKEHHGFEDDYVGHEPKKVEKHWSTLRSFMQHLSMFPATQPLAHVWSWVSKCK